MEVLGIQARLFAKVRLCALLLVRIGVSVIEFSQGRGWGCWERGWGGLLVTRLAIFGQYLRGHGLVA